MTLKHISPGCLAGVDAVDPEDDTHVVQATQSEQDKMTAAWPDDPIQKISTLDQLTKLTTLGPAALAEQRRLQTKAADRKRKEMKRQAEREKKERLERERKNAERCAAVAAKKRAADTEARAAAAEESDDKKKEDAEREMLQRVMREQLEREIAAERTRRMKALQAELSNMEREQQSVQAETCGKQRSPNRGKARETMPAMRRHAYMLVHSIRSNSECMCACEIELYAPASQAH